MTSTLEQPDTLNVTRRFKAERERVFAAFSTVDAMGAWFGPPGCTMLGDNVDFRVGGGYRLRIKTPDDELIALGEYREVTHPSKLVFTWKWAEDEDWTDVESVITIDFRSDGAETELRLTQVGFPSAESRDRHSHGWGVCFDRLDAHLAMS